jgi:hypothetical protein
MSSAETQILVVLEVNDSARLTPQEQQFVERIVSQHPEVQTTELAIYDLVPLGSPPDARTERVIAPRHAKIVRGSHVRFAGRWTAAAQAASVEPGSRTTLEMDIQFAAALELVQ